MNPRDIHRPSAKRLPEEPKLEELIEARERMDAGLRLAFPQLTERIGTRPEPDEKEPVDHEVAAAVGAGLWDAKAAVMEAAVALPLTQQDLHLALNGLVNEIDRITGELAERWGSE